MTVDEMRQWLLDARPNWCRETVMGWRDEQVVAIYHKELPKGIYKPSRRRYRQLSLFEGRETV